MSARTAQCTECADVFDVESTTGRLPTRCAKCKKDEKERDAAPPHPEKSSARKRAVRRAVKPRKTATRGRALKRPGIQAAIDELNDEVLELDQRRDAIGELIETLVAALKTMNGRHR